MVASGSFTKALQNAVLEFRVYVYNHSIVGGDKRPTRELFDDYLKEKSSRLYDQLERMSTERGVPRWKLVYDALTPEQQRKYGSLFDDVNSADQPDKKKGQLESLVAGSSIVRDYRENILPYLSEEQQRVFAEKLARMLYEGLSEEERQRHSVNNFTQAIMNLGYVRMKKSDPQKTFDVIITYAPLFRGSTDILDAIILRYIDRELTKIPIPKTKQRIQELRERVAEIYRAVQP